MRRGLEALVSHQLLAREALRLKLDRDEAVRDRIEREVAVAYRSELTRQYTERTGKPFGSGRQTPWDDVLARHPARIDDRVLQVVFAAFDARPR